jgi:radical SAM superfamily enzyme YgiQ (UPF0313 family)
MILLINPHLPAESPWGLSKMLPPLGLTYIAAALEKEGFEVKILDNYLFKKPISHLKFLVKKFNPEMTGISCNSVTYKNCIEIARAVKEAVPKSKVVVGGPHPTYMPESMLRYKEVDFAVMGEGELAMVELAKRVIDGDNSNFTEVPGIAYRHNGKIVKNPPRFIEDLDSIPIPARHLIPLSKYDRRIEFLDVEPVDTMNVIRGCPFNCKFCETKKLWGSKPRTFSPNRVVEEIEHLTANYNSKGIYFVGDNFTINKKWTETLCNLIKEHKLDIEWVCDTRVDLISRDLLKIMKSAGCRTIWFGVESGSPRVLEKLNKGITLQQAIHAFKLCREVGIKVACSFMLGTPGETLEDMYATLRFAMKLNPDWCQFNIFIACPGSILYDEVLEGGLYDRRDDFLLYVKTEDFNYESLLEIQKLFHRTFHKSPSRIVKRIVERVKSPYGWKNFINGLSRGFKAFIKGGD